MLRIPALLLCLVLASNGAIATTIELPPPPLAELSASVLLNQIDSLETQYGQSPVRERADLAFQLGLHYAALQVPKHTATAQEYFDEVTRLDPGRADAACQASIEYARAGYYRQARSRMRALIATDPENPDYLLALARIEFVATRNQAYHNDWTAPYQLYVTAMALAPEDPDALYGGAVTALLVENYRLARSAAERLRKQDPKRPDAWLVSAAAQHRLGNDEQSWVEFLRGLALSTPAYQSAFLGGEVLIPDEALAALARATVDPDRARTVLGLTAPQSKIDWYRVIEDPDIRTETIERWWTRHDASPDAFENESELEYWTRLVEADLIFGRPAASTRGWQTLPGEVWVRMGHPVAQYEDIPAQTDVTEQLAPLRYGGRLTFPRLEHFWQWNYIVDGRPVSVVFSDVTYGEPSWGMADQSGLDLGTLRESVAFVEPAHRGPVPPFDLGVHVAHFPRASTAVIETMVSIRPLGVRDGLGAEPDSVLVEWTLLDENGEQMEQVLRTLTRHDGLSRLLEASGQPTTLTLSEPRLTMVSATVTGADYQIRVRAIDPRSGRFSSRTLAVTVPTPEPGPLSLSSLQLSHGLPEWDPHSDFPTQLVKHGRDLIFAPHALIEGTRLGVYYEVRGLAVGDDHLTRFDVEYSIYRGTGRIRMLAMLGEFTPDESDKLDLATAEFIHESSGLSPDGLVVKGTEMDLAGLDKGDYILRVQVTDRISQQECASAVAFRTTGAN